MTYNFFCKICQKPFEAHQKMKDYDSTLVACPFCQAKGTQIQRLYQPHAVFFHGNGFYVNDSHSHNSAQAQSHSDK